ncbi:insulin-induced gene 1 protein isoform X2 [Peromyscus californicus insignis]|uniref:insulin-induced gene 1 protein isoform X2 n=1 Tax=Peromyscus californicus insignis TaxID=564181 RepID=UPI0022A73E4D|nr:insulin-induced gene 1 protein isoform X2 [Peromyscus californicus insignis]
MPRLHDHVWSCPSAGAARPYSLPRGMIAAARCPQGPGAPEPAPRGQRAGTAGCGARPGSWHHDLVQRSLVLFSFGVVLALVLNLLQIQRNVTLFPDEVIATIFSSAWWVPPCCGTAAGTHPQTSSISAPGSRVYFSQEALQWET